MPIKYDISNSMIQELIEYQTLLLKVRTSTGNPSFTSTSSSQTYTVSDNTGENGLLILLKNALISYMVTASDWNSLLNGSALYTTTTGTANAYLANPSLGLVSYNDGLTIKLKFNASNTNSSTINIDSLGVKNIKKFTLAGKVNLNTGDIIANSIYFITYDGIDFILLNSSSILALNGAYKVLGTNSSNTDMTWVESLQSLMTAQGDILYASSANTPAKLAKGLAYQGLRMNSSETAPEWGNVMIGGKQIFTATGTFTAPKTGTYKVTVVGGGGGGGYSDNGQLVSQGGGGGMAIKWVSLNKGDSVNVTVGAGGTEQTNHSNVVGYGNAGETSSFGAYVSATGGGGGQNNNTNTASGGGGGYGSGGDINLTGAYGAFDTTYFRSYQNYSAGWSPLDYSIGKGGHNQQVGTAGIIIVEW